MSAELELWGWDAGWADELARLGEPGLVPARVVAQHRGRWTVVTEFGDAPAAPTGRLRHRALDGDLPAVGDWVACLPSPDEGDLRIQAVLNRRSAFRRRMAGPQVGAQIVAANVDTVFMATSLNHDFKPGRLERYVAMARESGAEPVVLLTKADLHDDPDGTAERSAQDLGVAAVAVSSATGFGVERIGRWLVPGRTVGLVGSSGVGKSTLLNLLAGERLMATREIREDDGRGRHTTTHRELFRIAGGALVLDTPGLRELGLWDAEAGVEDTFADIVALAKRCRYRNCGHFMEPGCVVMGAVKEGKLDARRLRNYRRLSRELADQPEPAVGRHERERRFTKKVRDASDESTARKRYGGEVDFDT